MKQPILVLGANGFIGKSVLAALAATDWADPIAGVRRPGPSPGATRQAAVDATSAPSIVAALQGVTAVINCTAPAVPAILPSVRAVFDAVATAARPLRVIHLSTMAVYGSATGTVDESTPLRGDLGDYCVAKVAAESVASQYARTVIFRPGIVYGPGSTQWSLRFAHYLRAHRLGDLGAAGDGYCNLVHVEDVSSAIVRALQRPEADGRCYNLASADPPTWNEYLVRYARALGAVPVRRISARRLKIETRLLAPPLKIAEIAARLGKLNPDFLPPPIPPSLARLLRQEIRLDTRLVQQELDLRWQDLDFGLTQSARWVQGLKGAA